MKQASFNMLDVRKADHGKFEKLVPNPSKDTDFAAMLHQLLADKLRMCEFIVGGTPDRTITLSHAPLDYKEQSSKAIDQYREALNWLATFKAMPEPQQRNEMWKSLVNKFTENRMSEYETRIINGAWQLLIDGYDPEKSLVL